jgi:hypothetical protein
MNSTTPAGVPAGDVTRPVSVTDCPVFAGFRDEVTVAVVDVFDAFRVRRGVKE